MTASALTAGSKEHKDLSCRFFTDSFRKFDPKSVRWPDLAPHELERLRALPIWEDAVRTEANTALLVQSFAQELRDPDFKEAVTLNGFEEGRHAELIRSLVRWYRIPVPPIEVVPEDDAEWGFLKVGYGECFDSFFGFGLFALAKNSGFFPLPLVDIFEPVMQEEARHIIFHVNWVAYTKAQQMPLGEAVFAFRKSLAIALQAVNRIKTALRIKNKNSQDNFTMTTYSAFGDFSVRQFLEVCLRENERRLAPYDRRLLRPNFMPDLAKTVLQLTSKAE